MKEKKKKKIHTKVLNSILEAGFFLNVHEGERSERCKRVLSASLRGYDDEKFVVISLAENREFEEKKARRREGRRTKKVALAALNPHGGCVLKEDREGERSASQGEFVARAPRRRAQLGTEGDAMLAGEKFNDRGKNFLDARTSGGGGRNSDQGGEGAPWGGDGSLLSPGEEPVHVEGGNHQSLRAQERRKYFIEKIGSVLLSWLDDKKASPLEKGLIGKGKLLVCGSQAILISKKGGPNRGGQNCVYGEGEKATP